MERLVEKCCYDGKDIEIYRNEESGLWSTYVRQQDGAYLLVHSHPTKSDVVYDLEAKRKRRRRKLVEEAV